MPTDNVVPIDADVARAIARRAVKFRCFVAALATVWLGTLIPVLLFTPLPPLVPFLVLGTLLVLAEHRFVLFGDETSMSGSIIVAIASVFVFADTSPFAGPMLVASLGGLYLPHVRQRRYSLAITNASGFGLSAVSAALVVTTFGDWADSNLLALTACVAAALAVDWTVNSVIVGAASAARRGYPYWSAIRDQLNSDADVLAIALAVGALCASGASYPFFVSVLGVGLALAAFEVRLASQHRANPRIEEPLDRVVATSLLATAALSLCKAPTIESVALASFAVYLVLAVHRLTLLPTCVGVTSTIALALMAQTLAVPDSLLVPTVLVTALPIIGFAQFLVRAERSGARLDRWSVLGLFALGRRDTWALGVVCAVVLAVGARYHGSVAPTLVLALGLLVLSALPAKRVTLIRRASNYRRSAAGVSR